jgi:hypothetical protein
MVVLKTFYAAFLFSSDDQETAGDLSLQDRPKDEI